VDGSGHATSGNIVLVRRQSPDRCVFSHVHNGSHVQITLASHGDLDIVPLYQPSTDFGKIAPVAVNTPVLGQLKDAGSIFYKEHSLMTIVGGRVFKILTGTVKVGLRRDYGEWEGSPLMYIRFTSQPLRVCFELLDNWRRLLGRRTFITQFILNDDGTVSPQGCPHLALGNSTLLEGVWVSGFSDAVAYTASNHRYFCTDGNVGRWWRSGETVVFQSEWWSFERYTMHRDGLLIGNDPNIPGKLWPSLATRSFRTDAIATSISCGTIALIRGSYFEHCFAHKKPFAMRQDIPEQFIWDGPEAVALWDQFGALFLIIISYGWLSKAHPDPDMFHLRQLVSILTKLRRRLVASGGFDCAVVIDFCSLWQHGGGENDRRTPEQKAAFSKGLNGFNDLYVDGFSMALKLMAMPASEKRRYDDRGWTLSESILIDTKGCFFNRLAFDGTFNPNSIPEEGIAFILRFTMNKLRVPLLPADFEEALDERRKRAHRRGVDLFTCGHDTPIVIDKYKHSFERLMAAKILAFHHAGWNEKDVQQFVKVLRICSVVTLFFNCTRIGDSGARLLASALSERNTIQSLHMYDCYIGEVGALDLINVSSLRALYLGKNPVATNKEAMRRLEEAWELAGREATCLSFQYVPK